MTAATTPDADRHRRPWLGALRIYSAELLLVPTGLVTAGYLTRQLGASDYGVFTLAVSTVGWLQWTASALLARATNQLVAAATDWRPMAAEIIRAHALLGMVCAAVVALTAPKLAQWLNQPSMVPALRWLALELLFVVTASGYRGLLVSMGEYRWLSFVSAARWVSRMIGVVGFVWLGWSTLGAIAGTLMSSVVVLVGSVWRVGRVPRAGVTERRLLRDNLLGVVAPTALAAIGLRLFERADLLLLAALGLPAATLGHYGAAQNLTVVVSLLAATISPILLSAITRCRRDGNADAAAQLQRDALRMPWLVLPFVGLSAGASSDIVKVVYGGAFLEAAAPFSWLMMGSAPLLVVAIASALLVAADRPWWLVRITVPMVFVLLLGGYWLVPAVGANGAAIASLGASCIAAAVSQWCVWRAVRTHVPARSVLVALGLTASSWLLAQAWPTDGTGARLLKLAGLALGVLLVLVVSGELRFDTGIASRGVVRRSSRDV